jgi:hypothetical protein
VTEWVLIGIVPFMFTEELSWETLAYTNGKTDTTSSTSSACNVLQ